jgi:hypothetical protein
VPRSRLRPDGRRLKVASIAMLIGLIATGIALVRSRGVYVKVLNKTTQPMAGVQLVLGTGRRVSLAPIPPGRSSGAAIGHEETSDIRLVYRQPDGTLNDVLRVGFGPEATLTCADKIVLGVMAHQAGGDPGSMRFYISRRRRYDPAAYFPFAPGAWE